MVFSTPYNRDRAVSFEAPNMEPSMTVPDQAISVSELLARYTRGIAPSCARESYWDDNPEFDNVDPSEAPDFDLSDVAANASRVATLHDKLVEEEISRRKSVARSKSVAKETPENPPNPAPPEPEPAEA
jgi:hypothetical protein